MKLFRFSKLLIIVYLLLITFLFPFPSFAQVSYKSVLVSGYIGEYLVTIYGYTSPLSRVELTSTNVFAVTQSAGDGYFEFSQTLLPKNPTDLCLQSIDDLHRLTNPICIPPPPEANFHTRIGPVILPPSLTIDQDSVAAYQNVAVSGVTIPNSEVILNFYQKDSSPQLLPKPAHAYSLPKLNIISDQNGNYSTNLPTAHSTTYRLIASTVYQNNPSPLSNILTYTLPSLWYLFWIRYQKYLFLFVILIISLMFLFYLLHLSRSKKCPPEKNK